MKKSFEKCLWLIKTIRSCPLTFEEINERWMNSSLNDEGATMPKRTFRNYLETVQDMFNVTINCDRKDEYRYYVEENDYQDKETLNLLSRLFLNMTIVNNGNLNNRICDMNLAISYPQYFEKLVEAIENRFVVSLLTGRDFDEEVTRQNFPDENARRIQELSHIGTKVDYFVPIALIKGTTTTFVIGRNEQKVLLFFDVNTIMDLKEKGRCEDYIDDDFCVANFILNYDYDFDKSTQRLTQVLVLDDESQFVNELNHIHYLIDRYNIRNK